MIISVRTVMAFISHRAISGPAASIPGYLSLLKSPARMKPVSVFWKYASVSWPFTSKRKR